jgi:hypothetical protein
MFRAARMSWSVLSKSAVSPISSAGSIVGCHRARNITTSSENHVRPASPAGIEKNLLGEDADVTCREGNELSFYGMVGACFKANALRS